MCVCRATALFHPWHSERERCGAETASVFIQIPARPVVCAACQWELLKTKCSLPRLWSFLRKALDAWAAAVWEEAWEGLTVRNRDFKLWWTRSLRRMKTETTLGDIVRVRCWCRRTFGKWARRFDRTEVASMSALT